MARRQDGWVGFFAPAVRGLSERVGPMARLARADVGVARAWMKHRGAIAAALGEAVSETYTEVLTLTVERDPAIARVLAFALPDHLARVSEDRRHRYGRLLVRVARTQVDAVPLVMRTLPALLDRLEGAALARYLARALELHSDSAPRAESFLRMESSEARTTAADLRTGLALEEVRRTLSLYARAHCGEDVQVRPIQGDGRKAFTDGRNLHLPSVVDQFGDERDFLIYRVLTARNAGYIEFGTLDLDLSRVPWGGDEPPDWGSAHTGGRAGWPDKRDGELELERMLRGFPNPALARDLVTLLENHRIEAALRREYPGIARDIDALGQSWRPDRPDPATLKPAELVVEQVARAALGHAPIDDLEPAVAKAAQEAVAALATLSHPDADVHTTATAVWQAYLPAHYLLVRANPGEDDRIEMPDGPGQGLPENDDSEPQDGPPGSDGSQDGRPEDDGGYRGMADDPTAGQLDVGEMSSSERQVEARAQELMAAMQEESPDNLKDARAQARRRIEEERTYEEMAAFLDRMEAPGGPMRSDDGVVDELPGSAASGQALEADTEGMGETFRYPEWDAAIADHKPDWVRVTEYRLQPGDGEFVANVRQELGPLIQRVRRAFEALRPEALRRERGLLDGDEIDLDRAIAERIEVRAGGSADGRVYQRRRPRERDVAVAFLVDMSSSTNEVVRRGGKRVIEVEKEALVLTCEAVDAIGDACAIWGFSGYGRDQVAFYVAKAFSDEWDDAARERVGRISWKMENRDGAAIRHATRRMLEWPARVRLLVLLSDGRPLDCGCDHYSDRYAQEDTRMALQEARSQGVHPFCITVDPQGQAYLARMYGDGGYTVISDVEALPERLTRTYRRLTR